MLAADIYFYMVGAFSLGILSVFIPAKYKEAINLFAHGMALTGCVLAVLCALLIIGFGPILLTIPLNIIFGELTVAIDSLAAFFMLIAGVPGCAVSVYAIGYCREYSAQSLKVMGALYNAFILSILLVFSASHIMVFIIAWELMALVSFFLVAFNHRDAFNTKAAFIYVVITHVGTAFIGTAFLLLAAGSDSMNFAQLNAFYLNEQVRNIVFVCALIGFSAKAGLIPVHIWLPQAHPAAPSHISALMSGIMLKTAIYGLCRFFLDFLGIGPVWWGLAVVIIAIISAVMGILYALMENDFKRLLAYSSIENMGIILLGMGAGLIFNSAGQHGLATLAWTACLFHVLNHALFKPLLFMGAGAVVGATKTKDIEKMGGLIKKMPYTAVTFLIGAVAIAALPPLNGFASEWLTFQSLLSMPYALSGMGGKVLSAIFVALLGLTGALAIACFVKVYGGVFLAKPRSLTADKAVEACLPMLLSMAALATVCVLVGLFPTTVSLLIGNSLAGHSGLPTAAFEQSANILLFNPGAVEAAFNSIDIVLLLSAGTFLALVLYRLFGKPAVVMAETWTCGIVPNCRMEYTATGYSKPIRTVFRAILRPQRETVVDAGPNDYHGRRLTYHVGIKYVFNELYRPLNKGMISGAHLIKRAQDGSVQLYIGYITAITIVALIFSLGW